jgi:hypothetical protein
MVIEDLSREVVEEVSVDTTGLGLTDESTKKGGGQGTDTQQLEGMTHAEVEERKLRVRAVYLTWIEGQRKGMCVGATRIGRKMEIWRWRMK